MNVQQLADFVEDPRTLLNITCKQAAFMVQGAVSNIPTVREAAHSVKTYTVDFKRFDLASSQSLFKLAVEDDIERGSSFKKVTCTVTTTNAQSVISGYYLGWKADHAYALDLNDKGKKFFVTAPLNGCAILINGSRKCPLVVHANFSDQLPEPKYLDNATMEENLRIRDETRLQQWTEIYSAYTVDLMKRYLFDRNQPVGIFDPAFYFSLRGSQGRVFGLRDTDGWTFYYSMDCARWQGKRLIRRSFTGTLWPVREAPENNQAILDFMAGR